MSSSGSFKQEHDRIEKGSPVLAGHEAVLKHVEIPMKLVWATTNAVAYGFQASIIASSLGQPNLISFFGLGTNPHATYIIGNIAGGFNFGGLVGLILGAAFSDRFGRLKLVHLGTVLACLGAGLAAGAQTVGMLIAGRIITGMAAFCSLLAAIAFCNEIAPTTRRGFLAGLNGGSVVVGYCLASYVGLGFFYYTDAFNWRLPFILQIVLPIVLSLLSFKIPESPRWLVQKGREEEALAALKTLHHYASDPDYLIAQEEHRQITKQIAYDSTLPSSWLAMFTRYWKRSACVLLVTAAMQSSGIQVVANFGPSLYANLGQTPANSLGIQAGWITVGMLASFISPLYSDKVGRKTLLTFGFLSAAVTNLIEALLVRSFGGAGVTNKSGQIAAVCFIFILYVVEMSCLESEALLIRQLPICSFFFFSPGESCVFLYIGELFPSHIRMKGIALGLIGINIMTIWITEAQPTAAVTIGWKFNLVFVVLSLFFGGLQAWFLPETKNVTLESMAAKFGDFDDVVVPVDE